MPRPRCQNGTRRNKKTGNCEQLVNPKSNSKNRKTMKREPLGKKMPESQIERIIRSEKRMELVGQYNNYKFDEEEYEKKRNAMKELRFDRDLNLTKIYSFKSAYNAATNASKQNSGILLIDRK